MKADFLAPQIESAILLIRGEKVMLSHDLARLYGVETRTLNQAVTRNLERFPDDFVLQLTEEEWVALRSQTVILNDQGQPFPEETPAALRSQIVILKRGQHSKYLPYAFTEQGVAMLSSVLRSPRAVQVNVAIMRSFVRLRQLLLTNADLAKKLDAMERNYDGQFKIVFDALRQLMAPPDKPRREIGFHAIENDRPAPAAKSRPRAARARR